MESRTSSSGGRLRRFLSFGLGLLVLGSLGLLLAYPSGAAPGGGRPDAAASPSATGAWTIDGAVPDPGTASFADPYGSVQELGPVNGATTKLSVVQTATSPMLGFTDPPAKADLRTVWMGIAPATDGVPWLYLGWQRVSSNGSAVILFEFDKNAKPAACDYGGDAASLIASCNPWANRTAGDFILVWDQVGSKVTIVKRTFVASGGHLALDAGTVVSSNAAISANGLFGEAQVDLSTLLGPVTSCTTFTNVIPATVTGNSDTADFEDVVLANFGDDVYLSSCGGLRITKATDPADAPHGSFPVTVDQADGGALRYGGSAPTSLGTTLTHDGDSVTYDELKADGDYRLAENLDQATLDAGWTTHSMVCSVGGEDYTVTSGGTFPVLESMRTECTVTNDYAPPKGHLVLHKTVVNDDGGTAEAADWTLSATPPGGGTTPPDGLSGTDGVAGDLLAGTYTLSESGGPSGYAASEWECTGLGGGSSLDGDRLTIAKGAELDCTIANDDEPASLTVVKKVVNDDGGTRTASDFTLAVSGTHPDPSSFPGDAGGTTVTVGAGAYDVSEGPHDGYAVSYGEGCSGTIALGEHVTCTVTNDDEPATLVVVKRVVNDDGGTATAGDFSFSVDGGDPLSFAEAGNPLEGSRTVTLAAGTHSVTEPATPGYATTYDGCTDLSLANGETATCTITNDDEPASLTVVKQVVNDDGGTKTASDFTIGVSGNDPSPSSFPGDAEGTEVALGTGAYSVTEGAHDGYAVSYGEGCSGTIAAGEHLTCTITNDDEPATLTVVKQVVNDDGGNKTASDFTLEVAGVDPDPASFPGDAEGTTVAIEPGDYSVTEPSHNGYSVSYGEGCSGTIALGEHITCTVTNDDKPGEIVVIKKVVNEHGGSKGPSDFTIDVTGNNPKPSSFPGDAEGTVVKVKPGDYSIVEGPHGGYSASYGEGCSGRIALGQHVTCTVTNHDEPGEIVVIKKVVNEHGGSKGPSDFTIDVTGKNASPASFPGSAEGTVVKVDPGDYSVVEGAHSGYAATYDTGCSGTIAGGERVTCTITNHDEQAQIVVVKKVVNDNGGRKGASDFTIDVTGKNASPASFPGSAAGTVVKVAPGAYSVVEGAHSGYAATYDAGCSGTIALGQHVTCTITNDDRAPALHLRNVVINRYGGTKTAADWTVTATGSRKDGGRTNLSGRGKADSGGGFSADTYTLSDSGPSGYVSSEWTCVSGDQTVPVTNDQVTLSSADDVTCTITQTDVPRALTPGVDLSIAKLASPTTVLVGKRVVYTMTVTNKRFTGGAFSAGDVTVADPLPAGLKYLSATSTKGTCSIGENGLTCKLGTMVAGTSATIRLVARGATPGTIRNTAVVVAAEKDLNTADNSASATVTVTRPFTPPLVCRKLVVRPLTITVGKRTLVVVVARDQSGKPLRKAKVTVRGTGIRVTGKTGRKGKYRHRILPRNEGVLVVRVPGETRCVARLGVIGVFQPPVTG